MGKPLFVVKIYLKNNDYFLIIEDNISILNIVFI